jgi:type IV pilus assembly protein PilV
MSDRVMGKGTCYVTSAGLVETRRELAVGGNRGVGMLEFVVALLIFSIGMMGLLSAQLAGKKAGYDASQRSVATALARDILERMRSNPGQISAYSIVDAGGAGNRLPLPGADCDESSCTAAQLAAFDLWQWESRLLGETEKYSDDNAGGLVLPRACIATDGGEVVVAISWLALTAAGPSAASAFCSTEDLEHTAAAGELEGSALERSELMIATFIGER